MHTDPGDHEQAVHQQTDETNNNHMQADTDVNDHEQQAMIMDQDAQPDQEKLDNYNNISLDEPEPSHPQTPVPMMPTHVTIDGTDSKPDTACTLDHESPGFVQEGTSQWASQSTQEQMNWTYQIYNLSRVTDHWKTTDEFDGDPMWARITDLITLWAHDPKRQKEPDKMTEEHMPWLMNARSYFMSCGKEMMRQAAEMFEHLSSEPDTRCHLTALARNTRIAQVPTINATMQ